MPYEGHMFHDEVAVTTHTEAFQARAGDVWVTLDQPAARYAVETLEPEAHDSFFRWGFFNGVLEKKEAFSAYVFEDTALQMLQDEPALKRAFEAMEGGAPRAAVRSAGGAGLSLRARPAPCGARVAALSGGGADVARAARTAVFSKPGRCIAPTLWSFQLLRNERPCGPATCNARLTPSTNCTPARIPLCS
jgi:hypothetical protein